MLKKTMRFIALLLLIVLLLSVAYQPLCAKSFSVKDNDAVSISVLDVCSKDAPFFSPANTDITAVCECSYRAESMKSPVDYTAIEQQFIHFIIAFNKEYPPEV